MGWEAGNERHRAGVLQLLETSKRNGVPVDALGLQSHIGANGVPPAAPQPEAWRAFLQDVTNLGLSLSITELDVNRRVSPRDPAASDMAAAAYTRDYLDLTLSFPQVGEVLCWGMVDRFSWLRSRTPHEEGPLKRPLPYDDGYRQKPMREAIATSLRAAPVRSLA